MTVDGTQIAVPDWLRGERPRPGVPALVGAAGGLVVLAGVFALFEELPDDNLRVGGIALALLALLVGGALMVVERDGALHTAGVALAAGAVAPLAFLLVNDPRQIDDKGDFLVAGLVAVLLWALLFLLGPARGHGLFLGLALLGMWATAFSQTSLDALFLPFAATQSARLEAPGLETPEFEAPQFEPPQFTPPSIPIPELTPPSVSIPQPIFEPPLQGESLGRPELVASTQPLVTGSSGEPPVAPAVVSLLFGLLFLAAAVALDGLGLRRLGSAVVAVGIPALWVGVGFLGPRYGATTFGVAAVVAAALLFVVGVAGERRFTSWAAVVGLVFGVTAVVAEAFEESGAGTAVVLFLIGAALVGGGWYASKSAQAVPVAWTPPAPPSTPEDSGPEELP